MLYIFTGQNHVRRGIAVISKAVTLNFFSRMENQHPKNCTFCSIFSIELFSLKRRMINPGNDGVNTD